MTVNLGNPIWLTLVADGSTPADQVQFNGWRVGIPASTQLPTSIDSILISGVKLWGYARQGQAGPEWVMQPAVDPNIAAVNVIPGPDGWHDTAARQVFYDIGLALLKLGVPGADLRAGLLALYNAAAAERLTRS